MLVCFLKRPIVSLSLMLHLLMGWRLMIEMDTVYICVGSMAATVCTVCGRFLKDYFVIPVFMLSVSHLCI